MRAFCLPNGDDVRAIDKDYQGNPEEMASEAIRDAEGLLTHPLLPTKVETLVNLGRGIFSLQHHPIKEVAFEDLDTDQLQDLNETLGIIYTSAPRGPYRISYKVGYEDGSLPALIQKVVYCILYRKLGKKDPNQEDLDTLMDVWRMKRASLEKQRDVAKAG